MEENKYDLEHEKTSHISATEKESQLRNNNHNNMKLCEVSLTRLPKHQVLNKICTISTTHLDKIDGSGSSISFPISDVVNTIDKEYLDPDKLITREKKVAIGMPMDYEVDDSDGSVWEDDKSYVESSDDDDVNVEVDADERDEIERIRLENIELPDISSFETSQIINSTSIDADDNCNKSSKITTDNNSKDPDFTVSHASNTSARSTLNSLKAAAPKYLLLRNIVENVKKTAEAPDHSKLILKAASENKNDARERRTHLCPLCEHFPEQKNLKRHLLRVHKDHPEVAVMASLTKQNSKSKTPMKPFIYAADYIYNVNSKINKGEIRVSRAPQMRSNKEALDYTVCPKCYGSFGETDFRVHVAACLKVSGKHCRNIAQLGRKFASNCHKITSPNLKLILSKMRNDVTTKAIRYDHLLIEYGNDLVLQLRGPEHKDNICTQLRRLSRLKLALGLKKMDEMFSLDTAKIVEQIEKLSRDPKGNPNSITVAYPTVAQNLGTLVKCITRKYSLLHAKNQNQGMVDILKNFLSCFENDYKTRLSRVAAESHSTNRRRKCTDLPEVDDVIILYEFLKKERVTHYNNLVTNGFNEDSYLNLLKSTLTSLQVYNRRRPGDVERIYLEDYQALKRLDTVNSVEYNRLGDGLKDLSKEFSLLPTRGKLNNDIKLLVPPDVKICIDKIIEYRNHIHISSKNNYLFALPMTPTYEIRYPSAYVLLYRYARKINVARSELLTATRLRKHLATSCIKLNLNDNELIDLAAFMGHHVNIHKAYYRRNRVERDIPLFLRFINAAMDSEGKDNMELEREKSANEVEEPDETRQFLDMNNENISPNLNEYSDNHEQENNHGNKRKNENTLDQYDSNLRPDENISLSKVKKPRKVWSKDEKRIIYKAFGNYMNKKVSKAPSIGEIRSLVQKNESIFQKRPLESIKTWIVMNRGKKFE